MASILVRKSAAPSAAMGKTRRWRRRLRREEISLEKSRFLLKKVTWPIATELRSEMDDSECAGSASTVSTKSSIAISEFPALAIALTG